MLEKRKDTLVLVATLITTILFAGGVFWVSKLLNQGSSSLFSPSAKEQAPQSNATLVKAVDLRISEGEKSLVPEKGIAELIEDDEMRNRFLSAKERGVTAISQGNFEQAITELDSALKAYQNEPETRIYLSNALIGNQAAYTIAVAVPLGSQSDEEFRSNSLAILRGVAQAQKEINDAGRINGVPLKVVIVDDGNNKKEASRLSSILASKTQTLGVIGHFSSGTTLAVKEVYDSKQLPAISSTSTAVSLSDIDYVFRTVPSDAFTAKTIARYMLENLSLRNAVVFYGSDDDSKTVSYSESLSSEFKQEVVQGGGQVTEFDLSGLEVTTEVNPNAEVDKQKIVEYVEQKIASGVQCFMLAGYGGNGREGILDEVYEVIRANNARVQLFGGDELYDKSFLENIGEDGIGITIAAAWNRGIKPNSDFMSSASNLWGGTVNWFTATSYDATQAFAEAIRRNPTRSGIQQALSDSNFSARGALEPIRFTPSGDRDGRVYLVKVQPSAPNDKFASGSGYDFMPIP